jgi:hypothetical protein
VEGNSLYEFVFEGSSGPVVVAWASKNTTSNVAFGAPFRVTDLHTGTTTDAPVSYGVEHSPVIMSGVSADILQKARANFANPFPWSDSSNQPGDYGMATSVTYIAEFQDGARGLHPLGQRNTVTIDGTIAHDVSQGPGLSFTIDPNFCSYSCPALQVTAVLRRKGTDSAGFNLKYESTSGWKGTGSWYTIPGSDQWYTQTWTIADTQFVGKWGYNFTFDSDSTQYSNYAVRSVTVTKQ